MAVYPRDDIDRLFVSRKEGRGPVIIVKCINVHQHNVSRNSLKRAKEDELQQLVISIETEEPKEK